MVTHIRVPMVKALTGESNDDFFINSGVVRNMFSLCPVQWSIFGLGLFAGPIRLRQRISQGAPPLGSYRRCPNWQS